MRQGTWGASASASTPTAKDSPEPRPASPPPTSACPPVAAPPPPDDPHQNPPRRAGDGEQVTQRRSPIVVGAPPADGHSEPVRATIRAIGLDERASHAGDRLRAPRRPRSLRVETVTCRR